MVIGCKEYCETFCPDFPDKCYMCNAFVDNRKKETCKQGIINCFITYEIIQKEAHKEGIEEKTTITQFHFSGRAENESIIKSMGAVCSALLDRIGIKHKVNYSYKPMYAIKKNMKNYDSTS